MTFTAKTAAAATFLAVTITLNTSAIASADTKLLAEPLAGATMFFADRYATAYYSIDKEKFRTVVTIAPGPATEGEPVQLVNSLVDGESDEYLVGGYGKNSIAVTLELSRRGGSITAIVKTTNAEPNS